MPDKKEIPNRYKMGAHVDLGNDREKQEDYISFKELDPNTLFCVIADGTGSNGEAFQPAAIVTTSIIKYVGDIFRKDRKLFRLNPQLFIETAMLNANEILGAFRMGNEEKYSGYAASVTCILCAKDNRVFYSHAGNTRFSIIRNGQIINITEDHTEAFELYKNNELTEEAYYFHPGNLRLTSGIGVMYKPKIQTGKVQIQDSDILLLTTDGVHYAVQQQYIPMIVTEMLQSDDENAEVNAAHMLVEAAKSTKSFSDNITAAVIRL